MQNTELERNSWLKFSIIIFCLFLYGLATVLAGENGEKVNFENPGIISFYYFAQVVGVIILFILPAILFSIFGTQAGIHYLGITTRPLLSTSIVAGMGLLLAMPLINWLSEINQQMHLPVAWQEVEIWMKNSEEKAAELTKIFTQGTSFDVLILNLFVVAFMAAFSEELFFRGVLQKVSIECFRNKHVGIWISAALFSAFHMQFFGFFPRMMMGAYLGYMFLWSGSLWPGILAHFLNNGIAVYLIWLENRGVISSDIDKIGIEENQWTYVATSAIMVVLSLLLVLRRENKRSANES